MNTTADTLRNALDLGDLPQSEQEEILLEISEMVFEGTLLRLTTEMDDSTKSEFEALLDTDPSEEQVVAFCATHGLNMDEAVQKTLEEMQNDILAVTGSGSE